MVSFFIEVWKSGFHQEVTEGLTKTWVEFGRPWSNSKIYLKIAIIRHKFKFFFISRYLRLSSFR